MLKRVIYLYAKRCQHVPQAFNNYATCSKARGGITQSIWFILTYTRPPPPFLFFY